MTVYPIVSEPLLLLGRLSCNEKEHASTLDLVSKITLFFSVSLTCQKCWPTVLQLQLTWKEPGRGGCFRERSLWWRPISKWIFPWKILLILPRWTLFFLNGFKREFMCLDRYRKILRQLQVRAVVVQESRKSVCSSILLLGEKIPNEYVEGMP